VARQASGPAVLYVGLGAWGLGPGKSDCKGMGVSAARRATTRWSRRGYLRASITTMLSVNLVQVTGAEGRGFSDHSRNPVLVNISPSVAAVGKAKSGLTKEPARSRGERREL